MSGEKERVAITSADAAKKLDVTSGQVRRLYRDGKLEGYKLETDVVMIYRDSLNEYKRLRDVKYGKVDGWVSDSPPDNKAARRKTFRGGKPKTEAEMIAAGLEYREKQRARQRDWRRRKREEERRKAALRQGDS